MRPWLALLPLVLGCARAAPGATSASAPGALSPSLTGSLQQPIPRCGPRDSRQYIAREFRCKDGSNPFAGDLEAAHKAMAPEPRRHPTTGHLIDTYSVPCPEGPTQVFVDMYSCPEAQAMLEERPSDDFKQAVRAFDAGDFQRAVAACLTILDGEKIDRNAVECLAMTPAAMALSSGGAQALDLVGGFCGKINNPQVRAHHVVQVARWLARGGHGRISKDQFRTMIGGFIAACGLEDDGGIKASAPPPVDLESEG